MLNTKHLCIYLKISYWFRTEPPFGTIPINCSNMYHVPTMLQAQCEKFRTFRIVRSEVKLWNLRNTLCFDVNRSFKIFLYSTHVYMNCATLGKKTCIILNSIQNVINRILQTISVLCGIIQWNRELSEIIWKLVFFVRAERCAFVMLTFKPTASN